MSKNTYKAWCEWYESFSDEEQERMAKQNLQEVNKYTKGMDNWLDLCDHIRFDTKNEFSTLERLLAGYINQLEIKFQQYLELQQELEFKKSVTEDDLDSERTLH